MRKDALLFGESSGRAVISLEGKNLSALEGLAEKWAVPFFELGRTGGKSLKIDGDIDLPVSVLSGAFNGSLKKHVEAEA